MKPTTYYLLPTTAIHLVTWQRSAWAFVLLFFLLRLWQGVGLWQLSAPPTTHVLGDNFYWALHLLQLPQWVLARPLAALLVDILLIVLPIWLIYRPASPLRFAHAPLFILYAVCYNSAQGHHTHAWIASAALSLHLCLSGEEPARWWQGAGRYYACGAMLAAGLWKCLRLTAFSAEQMPNILTQQQAQYVFDGGSWSNIYLYLSGEGAAFAAPLWWGAVLLELSFIIGFFTRRADAYLVGALLLFVLADYLVMSLFFFEFALWCWFFVPITKTEERN